MAANNYDNWERLVRAVLRREQFRELSLMSSPSSGTSRSSSFSSRSTSKFLNQSAIEGQSFELPADYWDSTIDHREWTAMIPPFKQEVMWKSESLSFYLDKTTGKNSFMLGARKILVLPDYGSELHNFSVSRFKEVAQLESETNKFIRGRIKTQMLSPNTLYAAYLVFGLLSLFNQEDRSAAAAAAGISGGDFRIRTARIAIDEKRQGVLILRSFVLKEECAVPYQPAGKDRNELIAVSRGDGWMEIELGDFYVGQGDNKTVEFPLLLMTWTSDFVIEGIEFRPKRKGWSKGIFSNLSGRML